MVDAKLSDTGVLQGNIDLTVTGDDAEVAYRALFRSVPMPQWKELGQRLSYALNFAGDVSDVAASSPEKTSEPFHFSYSYERKDFPNWADRHMSSCLPGLPLAWAPEKDVKTLNPVWLGSPAETHYISHIEIPKGYRAAPPGDLKVTEDFADYYRTYTLKDRVLTTDRRLVTKMKEIPITEVDAFRKFAKGVGADQDMMISLSSEAAPFFYQSEIWDLPASENEEAARGYDDARDKFNKHDLPGEIASLKHALELDPNYVRAWLWLGEIYRENSRIDDALQAYREAVSIDPQQPVSYKALGMTLSALRRTDEAIPVWQELIKVAPNDRARLRKPGGDVHRTEALCGSEVHTRGGGSVGSGATASAGRVGTSLSANR